MLPAGVALTVTQLAGGSAYMKGEPPSAENLGGPPQETAYWLGPHMSLHTGVPEVEAHPEHCVGSSEMQPMDRPPGEKAPTPPSQLTPEG